MENINNIYKMNYGIYRGGRKIRKIYGNPRSRSNQRGIIVWDKNKKDVQKWVKKYGSNYLKKKYL